MLKSLLDRFFHSGLTEFDLLERYLFCLYFLESFFAGKRPCILDVGGMLLNRRKEPVSPLRFLFPDSVVLDIKDSVYQPGYVVGDGRKLPFRDNHFDVAISMDTLEHIAPGDRSGFLAEMVRVSRQAVLIAFPFDSPLNAQVDQSLLDASRRMFKQEFVEFRQHVHNGLPNLDGTCNKLRALTGNDVWKREMGSLSNFLHYFFFRYYFYGLRDRDKLTQLETHFFSHFYAANVDQGPFYRTFVFASKGESEPDTARATRLFDAFVAEMKSLGSTTDLSGSMPAVLKGYNHLLSRYGPREKICAVVLYRGELAVSDVCISLDHIVTQKLVEQEFEVVVIYPAGKDMVDLESRYPQARFLPIHPEEKLVQKILAISNADYYYTISEDNVTYTESINQFYRMLNSAEPADYIELSLEGPDGLNRTDTRCLTMVNTFVRRTCFAQAVHLDESDVVHFRQVILGYTLNAYRKYHHLHVRGKIVFATHLYHPATGGAETLAKSMAETCVREGYTVSVVTSCAHSTEAFFLSDKRRITPEQEIISGVDIKRVPFSRRFRLGLNGLAALSNRVKFPFSHRIRIMRFGPRSRHYLQPILDEKPDLVVGIPFPTWNVHYARKAAKILRVPFVLVPCFHIADPFSFHNKFLYRILSEADAVIALTETERHFFMSQVGIPGDRVHVIPPGVELEDGGAPPDKESLRKQMGIRETNVVLHLGQHGGHKKIVELIRAMQHVFDVLPDTALVIAGGTTEYTPVIKREAARRLGRHTNGNVYFFDDFSDNQKEKLYQLSDLFVSLSEHESFGIVFIEAMKYGLPIIGSVFSVARSLIADHKNGFLVNPSDPAGVGGVVVELLKDRQVLQKYARNSRLRVENEFENRIVANKVLTLMNGLLRSPRGEKNVPGDFCG
ncbi:MAG TPA: glycosyltransferase [Candidatus Aminicenantes bacterium]|nr:glycosyltransferase [Candidatus Aminicenantes bacterium]